RPLRSAFMTWGDGRHKLPVRAGIREAIGKDMGDSVVVLLSESASLSARHTWPDDPCATTKDAALQAGHELRDFQQGLGEPLGRPLFRHRESILLGVLGGPLGA